MLLTPVLHAFLPFPFSRIFTRVLMVSSVLGAIALGGLRPEALRRFGLAWPRAGLRAARTGALVALALLIAYFALAASAGHGEWLLRSRTAWQWIEAAASAVATGVLIGVAEEYLFRGAVFTFLRDQVFRGRSWPGMSVTSAAYALLHFNSIRKPVIPPDPGLSDGLQLVLAPVRSLGDWQATWPSAIGLFLFGLVLNSCAARTRSLYPSIGLHAGSVTAIRFVKSFLTFPAARSTLWGTYRVYDGVAGWGLMIAMGILSRRIFPASGPLHEDSGTPVSPSR